VALFILVHSSLQYTANKRPAIQYVKRDKFAAFTSCFSGSININFAKQNPDVIRLLSLQQKCLEVVYAPPLLSTAEEEFLRLKFYFGNESTQKFCRLGTYFRNGTLKPMVFQNKIKTVRKW